MRLIHTSDWHFGKKLLESDLISLQESFCDWFVDLVKQEEIDCVLISGDLYDYSVPREEAVDLMNDVLLRISGTGASIVMISGNHDSAERLRFGTSFMRGSGLHIRTERRELAEISEPLVVTGRDGTEVEILPLPYLDPERVSMAKGTVRNHENVLRAVIDNQIGKLKNPSRTIAMAHAFVVGGMTSDSERQLGGTGSVSTSLFEPFGYVALGHLHRPHKVKGDRLVYSGTPLPYSFSEEHEKSVRLVTVDDRGIDSSTIPYTGGRPVATLEGTLDELLTSAEFARHETSFIRARLTDATRQVGAMDRLRSRFPHALIVNLVSRSQQDELDAQHFREMSRRSEDEVVRKYVEETWVDGLGEFGDTLLDRALVEAMKGDPS
jgi:exonuclease SbcD